MINAGMNPYGPSVEAPHTLFPFDQPLADRRNLAQDKLSGDGQVNFDGSEEK